MTSGIGHRPVVLFRDQGMAEQGEREVIEKYFTVITQRADVRKHSYRTVIPRYSCLPFYKEFETDVVSLGGRLINSYSEHRYLADLQNWVGDLKEMTPKTWFRLQDIPEKGPFFLKGETNSLKSLWPEGCYAETRREAIDVSRRLLQDSLISTQNVYIREFIKLKTVATGLNGMPVANEFRFFVYKGQILTGAFYWSSHVADLPAVPSADQVPKAFLDEVLRRIGDNANFYVVDAAQTESGEWIVVELNDACMSGLSENDPDTLYRNLRAVLAEEDRLGTAKVGGKAYPWA